MSQQIINIGAAPNDGSGDQLRLSFNKCNDNFTELYAKGATEGLWNYNKTSTDTSTTPVSGRFRTNSGNYRDATQIAIHAITIQGIDRTSTLRALLVGDSIQCQDSTNSAAWCRYSLQSLPVDHGTWFQLNVTFQTDGGVTSGDNQEIVFVFTAGSGGSIDLSAYATLVSPTFTGDPKAPTPTAGDNDISIATTAFVQDAVSNATGGAAGTAEYNFSTSTSPPPNTGEIRVNNATASAATILWISNITRLGSDIKRILQQIQVGSKLVIQDKGNSANYASFQVAGALVDQTTYWEIPVTFSVGAGTVTNNARILFGVQAPGAAGNVSNSGTPTAGQYGKWVTATTIQGVAPATVLSDIGAQPAGSYQPLDGELTAIAGLTSAADQAPYFTGSGAAALMTVTAAARTVLDDTTVGAMLTTMGAQPAGSYQTFDATLTALAAYNTNGLLTQTAADTFTGRTLTGPAAGITVSNGNGVAGNPTLALANDLAALEALAGTNTIYYRSAIDTWSAITIGANLTFAGGTLAVTIPANYITSVSAPLSVTGSNLAIDLTAYLTTAAATAAYQPLDADLTAIAALAGTNNIYYRSAPNTWTAVTIGGNLSFTAGTLNTAVTPQASDPELTAIAGLISAADQAPYFTGSGTAALMTVTAAARSVLDDTSTANMLTTLGAQPAGSYQTLDGDLTSLAAAAGTNTIYYRSAADTWSAVTISTGLSFSGGNLTATGAGGNVSNSGTPAAGQIAQWTDATHIQGIAAPFGPPQGRLTLQSITPVMTTTQSAKTTIYYTSYGGSLVPIYDGIGTFTMQSIGNEISTTTTDITKNPSAIGASKCNDWYVWNDAGTMRLCHGPDWTNDTTRAVTLNWVKGIWLNGFAITNGPAASTGTYVGTTRSNASSQLDWILGASGSGGVAAFLGVWNAYNRVNVHTLVLDNTSTWTIASAVTQSFNGSTNNRVSAVFGLSEDGILAQCSATAFVNTPGNPTACGVGVNTTSALSGPFSSNFTSSFILVFGYVSSVAPLGFNFFQAIQMNASSGGGFIGESGGGRSGLEFIGRM